MKYPDNIHAVLETQISVQDIIRYNTKTSQAIQAVQEKKETSKHLEVPIPLHLKWLIEKSNIG